MIVKEVTKMKDCCKIRVRTDEEYKKLANRLNRIEGQVRGIRNMLEESAYCIDILTQVSAAKAALDSFTKELLTEHINTCVADDLRRGSYEKTEELTSAIKKLIK
ncbi:MAG: metal-sensing transcriptional repressor [Clostridia bacterium]|nr:metal-sensing transcriptional repressor [Clostridia bacterium]